MEKCGSTHRRPFLFIEKLRIFSLFFGSDTGQKKKKKKGRRKVPKGGGGGTSQPYFPIFLPPGFHSPGKEGLRLVYWAVRSRRRLGRRHEGSRSGKPYSLETCELRLTNTSLCSPAEACAGAPGVRTAIPVEGWVGLGSLLGTRRLHAQARRHCPFHLLQPQGGELDVRAEVPPCPGTCRLAVQSGTLPWLPSWTE